MSSSSVKNEAEGVVTATLAADDCAYEVSPRHGSVHLKGLNSAAREVLSKFDRNGDGEVDESELEGVVDVLVKEQFKGRLFLCGILMVGFSLVLLLASSFGLTWAIVSLHKDTSIQGQIMTVKSTNEAVELGSSDFTVGTSGQLMSRDSTVLATAPHFVYLSLNANMTTRVLSTLKRISVTGSSGAQVGLRVTGFAALGSATPARLNISTPLGVLTLEGDRLIGGSPTSDGFFNTNELTGQRVTGLFYTT